MSGATKMCLACVNGKITVWVTKNGRKVAEQQNCDTCHGTGQVPA